MESDSLLDSFLRFRCADVLVVAFIITGDIVHVVLRSSELAKLVLEDFIFLFVVQE